MLPPIPHCPRNSRSTAFTLLETLIVISITSVLAALLVSASGKVLTGGRMAATTSNVRQIGVAMQNYISENNGRLPGPFTVAVYTYGRDVPQTNDLPHLGAYLAPYLDAPANSAAGSATNYKIKSLECPLLSTRARQDIPTANYVTVDYADSGSSLANNRFGSWGDVTFTLAAAKPNQPKLITALTDLARRSPILSTADKESWVSVNNGLLPDKGVFDGKRMWLFIDGSQIISTNRGIWVR